jgi:hypothetical protein
VEGKANRILNILLVLSWNVRKPSRKLCQWVMIPVQTFDVERGVFKREKLAGETKFFQGLWK